MNSDNQDRGEMRCELAYQPEGNDHAETGTGTKVIMTETAGWSLGD